MKEKYMVFVRNEKNNDLVYVKEMSGFSSKVYEDVNRTLCFIMSVEPLHDTVGM
jgi:hypothetical protein